MTGDGQREGVPRKQGRGWRTYVLGAALVLLLILVFANLQTVEVNFLFVKAEAPLVIALLVAGGLGALIGWVWPLARAGRRAEREAKGTRDRKQG